MAWWREGGGSRTTILYIYTSSVGLVMSRNGCLPTTFQVLKLFVVSLKKADVMKLKASIPET